MGGFVGLFSLDGKPIERVDLGAAAAACRRPAVATELWTCGPMGLAHRHGWACTGTRPQVSRSGVAIALDGRVDEREAPAGTDLDFIADAYEESSHRFPSRLNGDFALAVCDPARRQIILARDAMGARRLHYTQAGRTLAFASEIKALLACPGVTSAPDEDAIADHVLDRWIDPHRTCFRGIYSVPPGHALVATPQGTRLEPYWAFDPSRTVRCRTIDEYAEAFRVVFEQAVRRRARSARPVAVSVSGGLDSSAIYCQAAALERRDPGHPGMLGISMTYPAGSPADEQQFLASLETVARRPIARVPIAELHVLRDAPAVVANLETPDVVWHAFDEVCAHARERGCSTILDGTFGDEMLFPRRYLVDLARRGSWVKVRHDLREFAVGVDGASGFFVHEFWSALFRALCPAPAFRTLKRLASGRRAARYPACYKKTMVSRLLERQLPRYSPRGPSASHDEYLQWAHSGHGLFNVQRQATAAAMHGLELASPYRDRDLIAFLMAIRGEIVTWQGTPKGLLRHALRGMLPEPIRTRRWKADFTFLISQTALREYETIERLLTPASMVVEYGFVDGKAIGETVARYRGVITEDAGHDTALPAWHLTGLAALELWLRHFFGAGARCTTS